MSIYLYFMIAFFVIGIILIIGLGFNNGIQNIVGLLLILTGLFLFIFQLCFHFWSLSDDLDMLLFTLLFTGIPIGVGLGIINTEKIGELNAKHFLKNFFLGFGLILLMAILDLIQITVESTPLSSIIQVTPELIQQIPNIPEIPELEIPEFTFAYDFSLTFNLPTGWMFVFNLFYLLPFIIIFTTTILNKIQVMKQRKSRWIIGKYGFLITIYFLAMLLLFYYNYSIQNIPFRFFNYE